MVKTVIIYDRNRAGKLLEKEPNRENFQLTEETAKEYIATV